MTKIENIDDLKKKATDVAEEVQQELYDDFSNAEKRNKIVKLIDTFMSENDLNVIEGVLGFVDLFSTIFATMLEENFTEKEEREASQERFNNLRSNLIDVLNDGQRKGTYMPETLLALLSLIGESMGIVLKNSDLAEKASK